MSKNSTQTLGSTLLLLLVSLYSMDGILSWVLPYASPHEAKTLSSWEPVTTMRERLGLSYNYTPSLLHPELCRYISAQECQDVDRSLQRHAQTHRRSLQQVGDNPNLGTVKVLVLLTQFTDHTMDRTLIEKSVIETLWNTDVQRWFSENSQGAYEIEPVVVDWMLTDNTEEYYSFDVMGVVPELQLAMYPLLDELDSSEDWGWSEFDSDQDGRLDAVVMMHSGYDAVTAGPDCQGRDTMQRIFAHAFSTGGEGGWTSMDGTVSLNGYAVVSAFDGICDGTVFKPGLICHEYMHTIGLIDLYDGTDTNQAKGIGAWDIMSNPYGPDNSGNPGFLSVWSKQEAEWITPETISHDGFYTLQPAENSTQAYLIYLSEIPGASEYLLIENRQQISFDEKLWDEGLMIYHIDELADGMKNRGYPGQDGWPENGNHYLVAVLPKDGRYDLEQNVNSGDAGDMWLPGDVLGPGMDSTVFPNADNYQGGFIFENGIAIRTVSQFSNKDVVFEVSGLAPAPEDATNLTPPPDSSPAADLIETTSVPRATAEPSLINPQPISETPEVVPATTEPTTKTNPVLSTTTSSPTAGAPTTASPTVTTGTSSATPTTANPPTGTPTTSSPPTGTRTTVSPTVTTGSPSATPTTVSPMTGTSTTKPVLSPIAPVPEPVTLPLGTAKPATPDFQGDTTPEPIATLPLPASDVPVSLTTDGTNQPATTGTTTTSYYEGVLSRFTHKARFPITCKMRKSKRIMRKANSMTKGMSGSFTMSYSESLDGSYLGGFSYSAYFLYRDKDKRGKMKSKTMGSRIGKSKSIKETKKAKGNSKLKRSDWQRDGFLSQATYFKDLRRAGIQPSRKSRHTPPRRQLAVGRVPGRRRGSPGEIQVWECRFGPPFGNSPNGIPTIPPRSALHMVPSVPSIPTVPAMSTKHKMPTTPIMPKIHMAPP